MEVGYVIPVLFLSNSLGTPLLPKTVETQDFEMALSLAEDKDSLRKWYRLDADSQPPCYRLLPVASHIPSFKVTLQIAFTAPSRTIVFAPWYKAKLLLEFYKNNLKYFSRTSPTAN